MLKSVVKKASSPTVRRVGSTVARSAGRLEDVITSRLPGFGLWERLSGETTYAAVRATNWSLSFGMFVLLAMIAWTAWSLQYRHLNNDRTPWEIAVLAQITGL